MSWRDWLYISKTDKLAIISLISIIIVLLAILFFINRKEKGSNANNIQIQESADHLQWKAQLQKQKEVEQETFYKEYRQNFSYTPQAKMKEGEVIELNTADTTLLKTIPGIGSGFANRIVNYREILGGFANIEQLNEVWGVDTYLYSQIIPYITLNPIHDSLYINRDSFEKLLKHPYLNYKQVAVITDIRERKGSIRSLKRLQLLEEFTRRDVERLSLYISFKPEFD